MKERLTAVFLCFLALVTLFLLSRKLPGLEKKYGTILPFPVDAENSSASVKSPAEEVIRLHILADSDSDEAQTVKLAVRDALLPYLSAVTAAAADRQEAMTLLEEHCDLFTSLADKTLQELGADYRADVSVRQIYFPIRIYGSQTYLSEDAVLFPPGLYDSLQIVLGKGEGHNWWCLAWPSLCFIDSAYDYIPKDSAIYKEKFATIKESSLDRLFYGKSSSDADASVNVYVESRLWNFLSTKIKKFMLH